MKLFGYALLGTALGSLTVASIIPFGKRGGDSGGHLAPLYKATGNYPKSGEYFVTFYDDNYNYTQHFQTIERDLEADNSTLFEWHDIANTYKVINLTDDCLDKIRRDPAVESVEESELWEMGSVDIAANDLAEFPEDSDPDKSMVRARSTVWFPDETAAAPWHLQVLSAGGKLDNVPNLGHATQLKYDNIVGGGQGVNIYVIDSGVNISHRYLGGRARNFGQTYACEDGDCYADTNGHGTAVAGLAAGRGFGTAQGANIVNVKAFYQLGNRRPSTDPSYLLKALKDIMAEHVSYLDTPPTGWKGSVINMSLGRDSRGPNSIRNAIQKLYNVGVTVVTAAGNDRQSGVSADGVWPCNMNSVCVGGFNKQYEQDWYSNLGGNVTILAPGSDISTLDKNGQGLTVKFGTSMAAPLVSGILAIFTGWENLGFEGTNEPNLARARLGANMLTDVLSDLENGSDLGGSENNCANTGINNPDKASYQPYKGVGEVVGSQTYTNYNPFGISTVEGAITLRGDAATVTSVGATTTDGSTYFVASDTAVVSTTLLDDDFSTTLGTISVASTTEAATTAIETAASTTVAVPSTTLPDEFTPTGSGTNGDGCIYVGCPDGYICNSFGNCEKT